jgi:hypothetical protein
MKKNIIIFLAILSCSLANANYSVKKVASDLTQTPQVDAGFWKDIPEIKVELIAQMAVNPKPAKAETDLMMVQAVHDGKFISFRLRWADKEKSEAGKLGEFSDAVAIEFPVLNNDSPPPITMGAEKDPVHVFHWRAQYQYDEEKGKKDIKDIYPNASVDTYPNEFPDRGKLKPSTEEQREVFLVGNAAGNTQSSRKKAVDEIMAEGFGSSAVREDTDSVSRGEWKKGEWVVVISRALKRSKGSVLEVGKGSSFGLAVWQGGKDEVGSRKAFGLEWVPFKVEEK